MDLRNFSGKNQDVYPRKYILDINYLLIKTLFSYHQKHKILLKGFIKKVMSHTCDAIVVVCIDFRFQNFIRKWTDENLAGKKFDLVGFAGSTKDLQVVLSQIDISFRLHQISEVILIHHEECGAYGPESTRQRHSQDLNHAKGEILKRYPNLKVLLYYLKLDGAFELIS